MKNNTRHIEILPVAAELFFENGYAATKMSDIARRAGWSKGLLYFYYKNKEDLFLAVLDEALAMNLGLLESIVASADGADGLTVSLTLLERFLELGESTTYFQEIIIRTMQLTDGGHLPGLAEKAGFSPEVHRHPRMEAIRARQLRIYETVKSAIEKGQRDGSITNQAPAAVIYLSIWSFIIGYETMLPVMKNHRASNVAVKHEYLLPDPAHWRLMILATARQVLTGLPGR